MKEISGNELFYLLGRPNVKIIDLRPVDAYNGWQIQNESHSGHIKGAKSLPASWSEYIDWIEMNLRALKDMEISSPFLNGKIYIKKGETIHTENSYKYTKQHISDFALIRGLKIKDIYTDAKQWFSVVHFVV
jgi:hypothetical protein